MKNWILGLLLISAMAHGAKQPNIILIYSDDHGYTDLGAHGIDGNLQTPHMDALARGGALMTTGYSSAPQCRPSRCGLLVGRIQNEFGFSHNHSDTGEGEGTLPRTYPAGTDMAGKPLLTIADRMKKLGYVTGFSGKWHCGTNDDKNGKYDPRGRGFDEYWVGSNGRVSANFNLEGDTIPHQKITDPRNRVISQGNACEVFIERNRNKKFFLYFPIFGPHLPRIKKNDPYYLDFPKQDYPHWDDAQNDLRRQGLALLKAMDDAVGGVVEKVRELGLEENTLILFAGDNGAPSNNGSSNVPMRGKKGHLHEGGIRVPMFAYWKGKIFPGQVVDEMVTTLDFTATTLAAGGGKIPPEFDGVDILPRLTGKAEKIARTQPMFWDIYTGQAIQERGWKLWRNSEETMLFHIAEDPAELVNRAYQQPERLAEMTKKLDEWASTLRPDSTYATSKRQLSRIEELLGAPDHVQPDPRYRMPYDDPKPMPYPLPVVSPGKPEGVERVVVAKPAAKKQPAKENEKSPAPAQSKSRTGKGSGFSAVDTNGDGQATLEEVEAWFKGRAEKDPNKTYKPNQPKGTLKKRDANGDGVVSEEEWNSASANNK